MQCGMPSHPTPAHIIRGGGRGGARAGISSRGGDRGGGINRRGTSQRDSLRRWRARRGAQTRVQFRAKHVQDVVEGRQQVHYFSVGRMDTVCPFCSALLWPTERKSICCQMGKVSIPPFPQPPTILRELWTAGTYDAKMFRKHARRLNAALALASQIVKEPSIPGRGYKPNFSIQVRVNFTN